MRVRTGLVRFVLEAAFLVVVAALLALLTPSWIAIVVILAGVLLLAIGVERYAAARGQRGEPLLRLRRAGPQPALAAGSTHVQVLAAAAAEQPTGREPRGESEREPVDEPTRSRGRLGRRARAVQPAAPEQTAAATTVPPPVSEDVHEPREWNIWELDRLARDGGGVDAARDEERALLLMHLREFAGPDGLLPGSFDDLVRESFGELAAAGNA
jgi:hypothetical protein